MHNTLLLLQATDFPPLHRGRLTTLQVNLGYRCNQTCLHCHVNAGPNRTETMDDATIECIPRVPASRPGTERTVPCGSTRRSSERAGNSAASEWTSQEAAANAGQVGQRPDAVQGDNEATRPEQSQYRAGGQAGENCKDVPSLPPSKFKQY